MPVLPRLNLRTAIATTALAAVATLMFAAPASAHITVGADDATAGATDSVLTFRVPNEEDTGTTVKVMISFPAKNPLASVKPAPKPGWTMSTTTSTFDPPIKTDDGTITEGVSQVVYTAKTPADGVPINGFDTFQVLVGPLPAKAGSLAFPTVQAYSDGKTVSWIEPIIDPANEPEHPAPILELVAGGDATAVAAPADATTTDTATTAEVSTARNLGITGIVIGVLALLGGAFAFARGRRTGS